MRYWKYLDLDWQHTSQRLLEYVYQNPKILEMGSYFKLQNLQHVVTAVPEVVEMLRPLNVELNFIAFFVQHTNICAIHVDGEPSECRINIPILNCQYSETRFFESDAPPIKTQERNGTPYYHYQPEFCRCVDRYVLDAPILLRVNVPHQVVILEENYPRISCLMSIKQNLSYMLE